MAVEANPCEVFGDILWLTLCDVDTSFWELYAKFLGVLEVWC